jgi:uncharacterized membrane protein YfcA
LDSLILIICAGAAAGFTAGLLGLGGGLIMVPALVYVFDNQFSGVPVMHMAVATSLAAIVPTAVASTWAHHRRGAVLWGDVCRLGPAIALGVVAGVVIAGHLSSPVLARGFAVYALVVALQVGLELRPVVPAGTAMAPLRGVDPAGIAIGLLSAMIGIGGGTLTSPYLLWRGRPMRSAVATSAACALPIAVVGCAGYAIAGGDNAAMPAWSSGYVYWPALLALTIATTATAPLGAHYAHRLPEKALRRAFAALLAVIGVNMLL